MKRGRPLGLLATLMLVVSCAEAGTGNPEPLVATFSIVAFDPATRDLGVAVQSKFLAVGSVVPWAQAGVGAIATQARANTSYGPRGLSLLASNKPPADVLRELTQADSRRWLRQVGIVDTHGGAETYTGMLAPPWAGGRKGEGYAVQGNCLASEAVVDAMATGYEKEEGTLARRLLASLRAGQAAGGDRRGRQSAALLVVRAGAGYGGHNDRFIDLRVDDHPTPIAELARLLALHEDVYRTAHTNPPTRETR